MASDDYWLREFGRVLDREQRAAAERYCKENERLAIGASGGPFWGTTHEEALEWMRRHERADHDPGDEDVCR